ncbi:hypothetical protein OBBRIDRAFT_741133 [Obba rivulosa]|uniref:Calcineurin-like phosphoesterase domain-containing protein n=1 Tax=Obba rivulosa TaxID=1052685 RepID=A0A8E2AT14_9APHY|nr:hypothetical protein OBBRIDRAFT_741133 [Obba rivulosa]
MSPDGKTTERRHARRWKLDAVTCVRIFWTLLLLWYELGTFAAHAADCPWPSPFASAALVRLPLTIRALLVADPQVLDRRSYPGRNALLMWLTQRVVDLNLRKSWWAVMRQRPDVVVFLGDMMDNGRVDMPAAEYESYYKRFKSIFRTPSELPVFYLPGNHDIGLGSPVAFSPIALDRYYAHFSQPNKQIGLGNHTAILINAPGLVDEDAQRARLGLDFARYASMYPSSTIAFVHSWGLGGCSSVNDGAILFTHIPLARAPDAGCGPLRERGTIHEGTGFGYQNTLSAAASEFLLKSVQPSIIFSGDDHDYCDYVHTIPPPTGQSPTSAQQVHEITVRSFSMAMGVRHPGYQLLSLLPQDPALPSTTLVTTPCLLPDQLAILTHVYVPAALLSLVALFYMRVRESMPGAGALPGPLAQRRRAREGLMKAWARDCAQAAWAPLLVWGVVVVFVL